MAVRFKSEAVGTTNNNQTGEVMRSNRCLEPVDGRCPVCENESLFQVMAYRCTGCNEVRDGFALLDRCKRCGSDSCAETIKTGDIVCTSKWCGYSNFRRMAYLY